MDEEKMIMEIFEESLLNRIGKKLIEMKETIAVAESVSSGLLQAAFSNMEFAQKFYQGGLTAYNIAQKFKHLRVEPIHAAEVNCVSEHVAKEMAEHVSERFGSHWGIAITGYNTPVPESGNQLFAYYAISREGKTLHSGKLVPEEGKPAAVQIAYVNMVLQKFDAVL